MADFINGKTDFTAAFFQHDGTAGKIVFCERPTACMDFKELFPFKSLLDKQEIMRQLLVSKCKFVFFDIVGRMLQKLAAKVRLRVQNGIRFIWIEFIWDELSWPIRKGYVEWL